MNEIQTRQMLYLMQEINNNLIMIKHFIGYQVIPVCKNWNERFKEIQKDKDEVVRTLARINDDMIKDSMY